MVKAKVSSKPLSRDTKSASLKPSTRKVTKAKRPKVQSHDLKKFLAEGSWSSQRPDQTDIEHRAAAAATNVSAVLTNISNWKVGDIVQAKLAQSDELSNVALSSQAKLAKNDESSSVAWRSAKIIAVRKELGPSSASKASFTYDVEYTDGSRASCLPTSSLRNTVGMLLESSVQSRSSYEQSLDQFLASIGRETKKLSCVSGHSFFAAAVAAAAVAGTPKWKSMHDLRSCIAKELEAEDFVTDLEDQTQHRERRISVLKSQRSGGLESDSTALYLQKRIEMHRSISCEVATCSSFEQDNMIDHIAIARMIYPARLVFFKPPHGPLEDVPQVHDNDVGEADVSSTGLPHFRAMVYIADEGFSTSARDIEWKDVFRKKNLSDHDVLIYFNGEEGYAPILKIERRQLGWVSGGPRKTQEKQKQKGIPTYNRYRWLDSWDQKYGWVRKNDELVWCFICCMFVQLRGQNQLAHKTASRAKMTRSKLTDHDTSPSHMRCMSAFHEKNRNANRRTGIELHVTMIDKHTVICRLIRTVRYICAEDLPVAKIASLACLQQLNGLEIGSGEYANEQFAWEVVELIGRWSRNEQNERITRSLAYSFGGDGTGNRSNEETEMMIIKYLDKPTDGPKKFVTEFFELSEVLTDRSGLDDGVLSVNAQSVHATYKFCLEKRDVSILASENMAKAVVSFSLDGAAVMMGSNNSVATRFLKDAPKAQIFHAVAHRLELSVGDACKECTFLSVVEDIIGNAYAYYHTSPKRTDNMHAVASTMQTEALKLVGIHGIRWRASCLRSTETFFHNLVPMSHHLMSEAFSDVGLKMTSLTASEEFLKKRVPVTFNIAGKDREYIGFIFAIERGNTPVDDKLRLRFRDRSEMTMSKVEVVHHLAHSKAIILEENKSWQMHIAQTSFRVVVTTCFLLDVHYELALVSMTFQSDLVAPSDVLDKLNRCLSQLDRMRKEDGSKLLAFFEEYNEDEATYRDMPLSDPTEGREQFDLDREVILISLRCYLVYRFESFLNNPIFKASIALEQRRWPAEEEELSHYGVDSIKLLASHYEGYTILDDFDLDSALHEWECLKKETKGLGFFSLPFVQFWEHLINHYDSPLRYSNILLLVIVVILNLLDTSACERFISRMNRIHTSARDRLSVKHTNDIMASDLLGPDLKDFDPKVILGDWLEGPLGKCSERGRYLKRKLNAFKNSI